MSNLVDYSDCAQQGVANAVLTTSSPWFWCKEPESGAVRIDTVGRAGKRNLPSSLSQNRTDSYGSYHSVKHELNSNGQNNWALCALYASPIVLLS